MNCNTAEKWIYLCDELLPSQQMVLLEHTRSCSNCSSLWIFWQERYHQFQNFRHAQQIAPLSADFVSKTQTQIRTQALLYQQYPRISWLRQQPFLQMAAAILFLAGVIHLLPPLLNLSFPVSSRSITTHFIDWSPPKKKVAPSSISPLFIPYQNDSFPIHKELERRNNQYFMQETSNQQWTQQIPYFSTPMIYSGQSSTDF